MMNEKDVVELLKKAQQISVNIWVTGGWGVSALVGYQIRPHNDLDVFIQTKDNAVFTGMLNSHGFRKIEMEFTTNEHTVWVDTSNRTVNLHLFDFIDDKSLQFGNETYPSDIFNGKGNIGGLPVRCLTAEAQILYHQGYKPEEKGLHDVLLLCNTFMLPKPKEYEI